LTHFNDICVNISPLLELPSLVFAVSYNCSLQDSGPVALSLGSDTSISFCSNQVVFNYFNTSIKGCFYKICSNFPVSTILLTLHINAL